MSAIEKSIRALEVRITNVATEVLGGSCTLEEYKASCATIEAFKTAIEVMREERKKDRKDTYDDDQ